MLLRGYFWVQKSLPPIRDLSAKVLQCWPKAFQNCRAHVKCHPPLPRGAHPTGIPGVVICLGANEPAGIPAGAEPPSIPNATPALPPRVSSEDQGSCAWLPQPSECLMGSNGCRRWQLQIGGRITRNATGTTPHIC